MRTGRPSPSWSPNRDSQVEPVATKRTAPHGLPLVRDNVISTEYRGRQSIECAVEK